MYTRATNAAASSWLILTESSLPRPVRYSMGLVDLMSVRCLLDCADSQSVRAQQRNQHLQQRRLSNTG